MMLTEREEEILEALWGEIIEKKNQSCDASIAKDDEGVKKLADLDYIEIRNNQIKLTNRGKEEARNCVRRHRLAERLMVDVLDIKKNLVHEASCKFEHVLHKGLDENVCILLGHPRTCPHGRPIPEGDCCKQAKKIPKRVIMPLSELETDMKATILHLESHDQGTLQKIIAIGALPNTDIKLIQKFPSYVFQIGKSQFAIDKELASCIYVRVI